MIELFNNEISQRLADLETAACRGQTITAKLEPPLGRHDKRLSLKTEETSRVLVFVLPLAGTVAAQFRENGHDEVADQTEAALAEA